LWCIWVSVCGRYSLTRPQCGQRHGLSLITILTKQGNITDDCGEFSVRDSALV
jgi:valyl-tRNA synthetase